MTREEAIETLHEIQRDTWPNSYTEKACEMAIKALEQEPCEDAVSREAAINAAENIDCSDGVGISALKCEAVNDVVTAIKALPSTQPEVIRCKDCKWWAVIPNEDIELSDYRACHALRHCRTKAIDFCSRAERREK